MSNIFVKNKSSYQETEQLIKYFGNSISYFYAKTISNHIMQITGYFTYDMFSYK
jgi:hypothetical protein